MYCKSSIILVEVYIVLLLDQVDCKGLISNKLYKLIVKV